MLTLLSPRIYKPKYMDNTPDDKKKDAKQPNPTLLTKEKEPERPKTAGGRQRARSIWGRKKEK